VTYHYVLVDDEEMARNWFRRLVEDELDGWTGVEFESPTQALPYLRAHTTEVDLVIADYKMPDMSGLELFQTIVDERLCPRAKRILISAFYTEKPVIEAIEEGVVDYVDFDFFPKPLSADDRRHLLGIIQSIMSQQAGPDAGAAGRSEEEIIRLFLSHDYFVGPDTIAMAKRALEAAPGSAAVHLAGKTGVGKDTIAHIIHKESLRKGKFVALNCAALNDNLLENELFGHERGAFYGADSREEGRFKLADGGTMFLDEVGEVSPAMQAKLLRVLESGTFERVGGTETIRVDVRIVSATNRDLAQAVHERRFREDLFWRLRGEVVTIPTLGERPNDLIGLVAYFLNRKNREPGCGAAVYLTHRDHDALHKYDWPGNVRQLKKAVESVYTGARGKIVLEPKRLVDIARRLACDGPGPPPTAHVAGGDGQAAARRPPPPTTPQDYVGQIDEGQLPRTREDLKAEYGIHFVLRVYALLMAAAGYHHPEDEVIRRYFGSGFDLQLMSWGDGSGVPTSRKSMVVVGTDSNGLIHIRIFDTTGNRIKDQDETQLPAQAAAIANLKRRLPGLSAPHVLTYAEKAQVIAEAASIVDQTLGNTQKGTKRWVELNWKKVTGEENFSIHEFIKWANQKDY
jgi:DNA-binding NtrC family response regulator